MAVKAKAREKLSFTAIDFIAHKHNVQPGAVIPALQEIQDTYGYIPPLAIERLAANIGVPTSEVYGIVTFYAQFRLEPLGDNVIKVCHGTACHLSGAEKIAEVIAMATGAKEGKTSLDGKFTVERVACIGCCSLAPCMMVNNEVHGRLTPEAVNKVVSQIHETEKPTPTE